MPAMMTHDFFGQDAFGSALQVVEMSTPDERDAFLLGNQGPDPLFYIRLVPAFDEFAKLGSDMHHVPPSALLRTFKQALVDLPAEQQAQGRAYLAGFLCHYLLDRTVHPLVYFWERGLCGAGVEGLDSSDAGMVHAEVERDLDEMVLFAKRNQTVEVYRPFESVLKGSDQMLDVVGTLYYPVVAEAVGEQEPSLSHVFPLSVSCFRIVQRLFWSPRQRKAALLGRLEHPLFHTRYSLVRAMSHRVRDVATSDFDNSEHKPWRDPFGNGVRTESFWDLYQQALEQVPQTLAAFFADELSEPLAHEITGGINFCGERVE